MRKFCLPFALTTPTVTEASSWKGLPIAMTHSPMSISSESPSWRKGNSFPSILTIVDIRMRVRADDSRVEFPSIVENDRDFVASFDHVGIRHDVAVSGHDKSGALTQLRSGFLRLAAVGRAEKAIEKVIRAEIIRILIAVRKTALFLIWGIALHFDKDNQHHIVPDNRRCLIIAARTRAYQG